MKLVISGVGVGIWALLGVWGLGWVAMFAIMGIAILLEAKPFGA